MAWKLVNLPIELIEKLEAYMKREHIDVYWKAIDQLLKGEKGIEHTQAEAAEQLPRPDTQP